MKRILFLTSVPPDIIEEYISDNDWSNEMLPTLLSEMGASVTIKRWADEDIIATMLNNETVTFLWAEDYIRHPTGFAQFLEKAGSAINANVNGAPRVINNIALVRWNMDKKYLLDMQNAGFDIPATEILNPEQFPSASALHHRLQLFQSSGPIVLKPSVSASSNNTRLVADISSVSPDDLAYLESCTKGRLESSLVIQQFEPAIALGEYSFIFIGEKLTHATLKEPKHGEFRCQPAFGGQLSRIAIEGIEARTLATVQSIFDTLRKWFGEESTGEMGYLRIDGLVTKDRAFVLMEIEAIEPSLNLEMGGLQEMLSLLLSVV
ncbi:hypothetical protein BDW59DRAFT_142851 [Aspergillus cavernicola]|uniref:Prokaryotic glutathione synthetase ATP-binding domain-containing protein n=1 Tax=Aspergillus cavernicola TaxID=176166 RepID=A0ABR4IPD9_9EURO